MKMYSVRPGDWISTPNNGVVQLVSIVGSVANCVDKNANPVQVSCADEVDYYEQIAQPSVSEILEPEVPNPVETAPT
jgi:hypothetical protein